MASRPQFRNPRSLREGGNVSYVKMIFWKDNRLAGVSWDRESEGTTEGPSSETPEEGRTRADSGGTLPPASGGNTGFAVEGGDQSNPGVPGIWCAGGRIG